MNDLVNRLSLAAAQAKMVDRAPGNGKLLLEAAEAIEAAEARLLEVTGALREMIDLSDSRRSRELAEVKRILATARHALAAAPSPGSRPADEKVAGAFYGEFRAPARGRA